VALFSHKISYGSALSFSLPTGSLYEAWLDLTSKHFSRRVLPWDTHDTLFAVSCHPCTVRPMQKGLVYVCRCCTHSDPNRYILRYTAAQATVSNCKLSIRFSFLSPYPVTTHGHQQYPGQSRMSRKNSPIRSIYSFCLLSLYQSELILVATTITSSSPHSVLHRLSVTNWSFVRGVCNGILTSCCESFVKLQPVSLSDEHAPRNV
jgi:hypothetical protein